MIRLRWLLRLYPPRWRRRYGDEFLALLEELPLGAAVVFDVVRAAADRRLAGRDDAAAPARRTGGSKMTEAGESQGQSGWAGGITPTRHERTLGLLGLVLLLPTLSFLVLAVLKYGMGIAEPFDLAEPLFLNRLVEMFAVAAPWVAFVSSTWPVVRVRLGWEHGSFTGTLAVRARPLNLAVSLLSAALIGVLVVYFLVENF